MAAVNVRGRINTLVNTGGQSTILQGFIDGRVKSMVDDYTADATEDAGSTIKVGGTLPTGAKIVGVQISNTAQAASVTLAVGDSDDPDRYITAYAADSVRFNNDLNDTGNGYVVGTNSGDNQVLITTAGATLTASDVIKVVIFYVMD